MELHCRRREFVEKTIYLVCESLTTSSRNIFECGMWRRWRRCTSTKLKMNVLSKANKDVHVRPFNKKNFSRKISVIYLPKMKRQSMRGKNTLKFVHSKRTHSHRTERKQSIIIKNVSKTVRNACCDQSSGPNSECAIRGE